MIIFLVQLAAVTSGYTFCLPEKPSPRSCWKPFNNFEDLEQIGSVSSGYLDKGLPWQRASMKMLQLCKRWKAGTYYTYSRTANTGVILGTRPATLQVVNNYDVFNNSACQSRWPEFTGVQNDMCNKAGYTSCFFAASMNREKLSTTRNRKHRRAAAKPAVCAKPLMLSTLGSKGKRAGRVR